MCLPDHTIQATSSTSQASEKRKRRYMYLLTMLPYNTSRHHTIQRGWRHDRPLHTRHPPTMAAAIPNTPPSTPHPTSPPLLPRHPPAPPLLPTPHLPALGLHRPKRHPQRRGWAGVDGLPALGRGRWGVTHRRESGGGGEMEGGGEAGGGEGGGRGEGGEDVVLFVGGGGDRGGGGGVGGEGG